MRTVNEILDRYVQEYLPKLGLKTRQDYTRSIRVLREHFGERVAAELAPVDFDAFMNVEKGRIRRNRQLAVLSSAFTHAVFDWKVLPFNVCMQVEKNPQKARDRYVTTDEFERFKSVLISNTRRNSLALAMDLAVTTGLIQGEILSLRWADIDSNTITYKETTSGKILTKPVTQKVQSILNECRALSPSSQYVVPEGDGNRYTNEGFRSMWQRKMRSWGDEGNERFTFQDLHSKWDRDRQRTGIAGEISELVSRPNETPGVELKQWMVLSDPVTRANLARHLAALANSGGGYLIFGFRKDGTPDPNHPGDLSAFNNDEIASIVDKYLTPPFHCEVTMALPRGGGETCVCVRVPSHGSVPVCAKAGGPHDSKGRPQGILIGRYYTRVNGPKSTPIETPEQWEPIIRRCVLNERQALLDSIAALLKRPPTPGDASPLVAGPKRDRRTRPPDERGRVRIGHRRRRHRRQ